MKKLNKIIFSLACLAMFGCENEKECVEEFEIWDDVRYTQIEQEGLEEEDQMAHAFCSDLSFEEHFASCAVITYDTLAFPAQITVDYGSGCENERGRIKSGKVFFTIHSDLDSAAGSVDVDFENFAIDGYSIEGTRTLTNNGRNEQGHQIITTQGVITGSKEDWKRIRTFRHVREWVAGEETCDIRDDEYHYTGTWTIDENGEHSIATVTKPIVWVPGSCNHATEGTIKVSSGIVSAEVDFGDGTCDQYATLTIFGKSYEEDLEKDHCED